MYEMRRLLSLTAGDLLFFMTPRFGDFIMRQVALQLNAAYLKLRNVSRTPSTSSSSSSNSSSGSSGSSSSGSSSSNSESVVVFSMLHCSVCPFERPLCRRQQQQEQQRCSCSLSLHLRSSSNSSNNSIRNNKQQL
ncbi:hypothetical protein ACSSS7_007967 [Eimeria intestinalis]